MNLVYTANLDGIAYAENGFAITPSYAKLSAIGAFQRPRRKPPQRPAATGLRRSGHWD